MPVATAILPTQDMNTAPLVPLISNKPLDHLFNCLIVEVSKAFYNSVIGIQN